MGIYVAYRSTILRNSEKKNIRHTISEYSLNVLKDCHVLKRHVDSLMY